MTAIRRRLRMLAMIGLALMATILVPAQSTEASNATMTYVRFNRYGTNIYATYCASATSHAIAWGQTVPSYWSLDRFYGTAMNGCVTRLFWTNVEGNEELYWNLVAYPTTYGQDYARNSYVLYVTASGPNNISCSLGYADTALRRDPRLVSNTACAFWDQ